MKLLLAALVALAFSVGAMAQQDAAAPANPSGASDAVNAGGDAKKDDSAKHKKGKNHKKGKKDKKKTE